MQNLITKIDNFIDLTKFIFKGFDRLKTKLIYSIHEPNLCTDKNSCSIITLFCNNLNIIYL